MDVCFLRLCVCGELRFFFGTDVSFFLGMLDVFFEDVARL